MDEYVSKELHEEFVKRMEAEHHRQNRRIELLEKATEQNNKLLLSVEKLALSMENMQKEQKDQGERLEVLESRDGENWRKAAGYVMTAVLSVIIGYLFNLIVM